MDTINGVSSILDTPFGDLIEPFARASSKDPTTMVFSHANGAVFRSKVIGIGGKPVRERHLQIRGLYRTLV